jgi:hypothetical protein
MAQFHSTSSISGMFQTGSYPSGLAPNYRDVGIGIDGSSFRCYFNPITIDPTISVSFDKGWATMPIGVLSGMAVNLLNDFQSRLGVQTGARYWTFSESDSSFSAQDLDKLRDRERAQLAIQMNGIGSYLYFPPYTKEIYQISGLNGVYADLILLTTGENSSRLTGTLSRQVNIFSAIPYASGITSGSTSPILTGVSGSGLPVGGGAGGGAGRGGHYSTFSFG